MENMLDMFIFEFNQLNERLEEILIEGEKTGQLDTEAINEIFRIMHTIKGSAAMMEFTVISTLAHSVEDMFFFIRENPDTCNPDWPRICDLVLQSSDFFKDEVEKIQAGGANDGDTSKLLQEIKAYMPVLKGEAAPEQSEQAEPGAQKSSAESANEPLSTMDGNYFHVKVFFEEGCKMENVRAYQILTVLQDLSEDVSSNPPDLLEDCSDEIISNGVEFMVKDDMTEEKLRQCVSEALFVKSFEITPIQGGAALQAAPAEEEHAEEAAPAAAPDEQPQAVAAPAPTAPAPKSAAAPVAAAESAPRQSYISVSVDKLDKLMDLVGELVTSVSMVIRNPDLDGLQLDNFEKSAAMLRKNADEMQDTIMSVRMIPVSSTFHKMHRIVRDTSRKIGKEVELILVGEETEVDKNIIDTLSDPLMHLIRNALDHGVEDSRDERLAKGKPPVGRIVLEARNAGGDVIISITDDGRGLNRERILAKAKTQGLVTKPESELTDREIYNFIMLPGFSTKEQVTELSGRGVGMDVVKKNIEKVGGTITLDSTPGLGSVFTIKIPLTLAILKGMEINVGNNTYIVPTLNIRESFKPTEENIIVDPDGNEMIMLRGEVFPVVRLHRLFDVVPNHENFQEGIILMGEDDGKTIGIFCDRLIGEEQVVVKPIPAFILKRIGTINGVSGCTIMGDGSVNLIIDIKGLVEQNQQ